MKKVSSQGFGVETAGEEISDIRIFGILFFGILKRAFIKRTFLALHHVDYLSPLRFLDIEEYLTDHEERMKGDMCVL